MKKLVITANSELNFVRKLKQKLSNQFVRNMGWLGLAELISRICRLATTVIIARLLTPHDYGVVAIVMTIHEFANVFATKSGFGYKIVQADEKDLKAICDTAYWLNWILCGSLFIIQCIASFPVAWFYHNNQLILPICVVAVNYLIMPSFAVQSALIQRENRLSIFALCNFIQSLICSILAVLFVLLGLGMWALILPYPLTTFVWVFLILINHTWRSNTSFTLYRWQEIVSFSKAILGVELLNKIKANLDYLLVGYFLGVEALGVYYFAFNAGLGISLSVINISTTSLFPHLCAARADINQLKARYISSLKIAALVVVPLVIVQSSFAPFYVPIVFGQKWEMAVPIVSLTCLSALPRPFAEAATVLLQVIDKSDIALYWNVAFTLIFAVALLIFVKWGIVWVAASVLITHILGMPVFTVWASRYTFSRGQPS